MEDYDREAFSHMKESAASKPDKLFEYSGGFTESEYNTNASVEDRAKYDAKAFSFLAKLYEEDKGKGRFKDLNFTQFLETLKPSYIEEKFGQSREGDDESPKNDPEYYQRAGDMLLNIYEGDSDQLKVSATNFYKANYDFYGGGTPGTIRTKERALLKNRAGRAKEGGGY